MAGLIFIAEDDTMVLEIYERVFAAHGYRTVAAHDGQESLDMLAALTEKPTLILLDIMMPKVSGFEVLKFIKTKPELRDIPVMFVTNLSAPEDIKQGLEMGADKYLVKSEYDPQQIVNVINDLISGKAHA